MAATAPKCNVTVFTPAANPFSPSGLRSLPPNATLADVINVINHNVAKNEDEFNRLLTKDINQPTTKKGFNIKPSQVKRAADNQIKKLAFVQKAIVRKKIRVENPDDEDQYVIDNRVVNLVMTDRRTGAAWVFSDKQAAQGISAGSEESTQGQGG